jgi:translocation and assembly module TamB
LTEDTPAPKCRIAWWRWIVSAVMALVAILGAALLIVDTDIGHRFVADRIAAIKTANELRFTVGRIDGSVYGDTRLIDVRVYDL